MLFLVFLAGRIIMHIASNKYFKFKDCKSITITMTFPEAKWQVGIVSVFYVCKRVYLWTHLKHYTSSNAPKDSGFRIIDLDT